MRMKGMVLLVALASLPAAAAPDLLSISPPGGLAASIAAVGQACPAAGVTSFTSAGDPLYCKNGVWTSMAGSYGPGSFCGFISYSDGLDKSYVRSSSPCMGYMPFDAYSCPPGFAYREINYTTTTCMKL